MVKERSAYGKAIGLLRGVSDDVSTLDQKGIDIAGLQRKIQEKLKKLELQLPDIRKQGMIEGLDFAEKVDGIYS